MNQRTVNPDLFPHSHPFHSPQTPSIDDNMAETSTSQPAKGSANIGKSIQKRVVRTKEKVLVKVGKHDQTKDDTYDEHVTNFQKQQHTASKLQKELKSYTTAVRNMCASSKSFYEVVQDTYEEEWVDSDEIKKSIQALSHLCDVYTDKLSEQVQVQLQTYLSCFPPTRMKMSKRGRKLVYYDNVRHTLDALEVSKKPDELKIARVKDELAESERVYKSLNNELNEELPEMYHGRMKCLANIYQSLLSIEGIFMEESAKVRQEMMRVAEKLEKRSDEDKGVGWPARERLPCKVADSPSISMGNKSTNAIDLSACDDLELPLDLQERTTDTSTRTDIGVYEPAKHVNGVELALINGVTETIKEEENGGFKTKTINEKPQVADIEANETRLQTAPPKYLDGNGSEDSDEEVVEMAEDPYQVPESNRSIDQPANNLPSKVIATHPYVGEDTDELSFEAGELIEVIPFEDPDEQDEGWLMGIRISDGVRGVFPANFTKKM